MQVQIDEVDATIHDIRTAVFALNPAWPAPTDDPPPSPDLDISSRQFIRPVGVGVQGLCLCPRTEKPDSVDGGGESQ